MKTLTEQDMAHILNEYEEGLASGKYPRETASVEDYLRKVQPQHYTELKPKDSSHRHFQDWEVYRREVRNWVAEGKLGWTVVIHDGEVMGLYQERDEALRAQSENRLGTWPLIHTIAEYEYPLQHPTQLWRVV